MIDEDDMMLESYLLKHSDIEVCCDWGTQNDALYGNHVYEVIYNKYTDKYEVII